MGEKVTLATLKQLKEQKKPITVLTCYDYSTAVLLQDAGVNFVTTGFYWGETEPEQDQIPWETRSQSTSNQQSLK